MLSDQARGALWDALDGGAIRFRELRLTREEADALLADCPGAVCRPMVPERNGKSWYKVSLEGER